MAYGGAGAECRPRHDRRLLSRHVDRAGAFGASAPYYGGGDVGPGNYGGGFQNGRNPPAPIWFQSYPGNGSTGAKQGSGPAPSGLPRVYPSAQVPPAPRT